MGQIETIIHREEIHICERHLHRNSSSQSAEAWVSWSLWVPTAALSLTDRQKVLSREVRPVEEMIASLRVPSQHPHAPPVKCFSWHPLCISLIVLICILIMSLCAHFPHHTGSLSERAIFALSEPRTDRAQCLVVKKQVTGTFSIEDGGVQEPIGVI
jgi:hypothetical protein